MVDTITYSVTSRILESNYQNTIEDEKNLAYSEAIWHICEKILAVLIATEQVKIIILNVAYRSHLKIVIQYFLIKKIY